MIQKNLPPAPSTTIRASSPTTSVAPRAQAQTQTNPANQSVQSGGSGGMLLEVWTAIINFFEKLLSYL
jgi:hypothetical protein